MPVVCREGGRWSLDVPLRYAFRTASGQRLVSATASTNLPRLFSTAQRNIHTPPPSFPAHDIRKFAVQGDRSVAYVLHCDDCQLGIGCMLKKSSGKSNCILSISYPHKYNIRLLKCIFKVIINTVSYNGICFIYDCILPEKIISYLFIDIRKDFVLWHIH